MNIVVPGSRVRAQPRNSPRLGVSRVAPVLLAACLVAGGAAAQPLTPGGAVEELLALARERTPELAVMRLEAEAAAERVGTAGAFHDPMFRVALQDVENDGRGLPTLLPNRVGATKYTVLQPLPWFGKRDLRRAGAEADA